MVRNMGKKKIKSILISLAILVVILAVIVLIHLIQTNNTINDSDAVPAMNSISETSVETQKPTEIETETKVEEESESETTIQPTDSTEKESEDHTQPATDSSKIPEYMQATLSGAGYSVDNLSAEQLIIVDSRGSSATVSMYDKLDDGTWVDTGLTTYGYVGQNGVDVKSQEGDYKTPYGLYHIGDMFYIDDKPQTKLNSFQVTEQTYWVDDPNSAYYNQRVEGTYSMDWNSAEHMKSYYSSYKYGFVIDYNTNPIVAGKGSAIFFHIGYSPTAGCVAVSENDVLSYLSLLDKNKNPYILMV